MNQEERGPLVRMHRDGDFRMDKFTALTIDQLIQARAILEPIIVRTEDERDYIEAMALMQGVGIRALCLHGKIPVAQWQAAAFISIDLTSG